MVSPSEIDRAWPQTNRGGSGLLRLADPDSVPDTLDARVFRDKERET